MTTTTKPRLCLAASGGGHVRQLLDLQPLWSRHEYFFVTEDTALGQSIAKKHETHFVPHFAIGQAKLGKPLAMLGAAFRSLLRSFGIIRKKRPDVVITTGAGSQLFIVFWARLLGARIILIDSFARFDSPSGFARLAGPLAHHRLAQSEVSGQMWKGAEIFDPLRETQSLAGEKEDLVFATVGATLPFPRLTRTVLAAKQAEAIPEKVILQVGKDSGTNAECEGLEIVETLPFDTIKSILARARIVVCHGGTGSIITALQHGCATIVLPRRFEHGEHYDNHQAEITQNFVGRGLVLTAETPEEFEQALLQARTFTPRAVATDYTAMIQRLDEIVKGRA
ncbi:beta-1,4-glucuronosyltransferase WelK [Aurantiacibacter odishensis]|uniref:beta-1,4-glucuronosyltransferase WelK n=1 Tax=Aurantiacibacter odishensis TaxID=1155476 RepID=UPI000E74AA52|nr:glycosyltransferase [Aurantiacibacter odishensis]